jgi:arginase family enzyme
MIVSIPYTDGEHQACAQGPAKILEQLKYIWTVQKPIVKECSLDNIEPARIYLGGDHTITYYTVKKFVQQYPNTGFIVFDAHPDVFQAFDKPSHQDYLKFLIEEGILKPENIIVMGIRAQHPQEIHYFKEKGIRYVPCRNLMDVAAMCDGVMEFLRPFAAVYISVDLDVLDPAYAPGVSYIEPGGYTSRELLYFLQRLKRLPNVKTIDVVELNPEKDSNSITAKTAAKIVAEFL